MNVIKDMNELYLGGPDAFRNEVERLMTTAEAITDSDARERAERAAAAADECRELIAEPDLLTRMVAVAHRLGFAGDERALKLVYLAFVSRVLSHPVTVVVKGVSSSGKSRLAATVSRFFPDSGHFDHIEDCDE
jgi:hypothetical protein